MKFIIKDNENTAGLVNVEADSPREALETYVRNECYDADDGEEVNVEIADETGKRWEGTAEIEVVREIHTFVEPIRVKKGA